MIRTPEHLSVAVRKPNGRIVVRTERIVSLTKRFGFLKLPLLRGVIALYETLLIGVKALLFSAQEASEEEKITKKELIVTFSVATLIAVALFVLLPLFLASITVSKNIFLFNIVDGVARLVIFLAYLLVIASFKDVKRMFAYHGAEHMAVHAHEHKKKLTVQNVKKFKTMHPRCGTSFLLIVLMVSILVFSFIAHPNFFIKFFSRLLLIPVIAGISYEILRFSARFSNTLVGKVLVYPGVALQRITTKLPDKGQIEVAIAALKSAVRASRAPSR
jgi:uncharacterized protein YqhQ